LLLGHPQEITLFMLEMLNTHPALHGNT